MKKTKVVYLPLTHALAWIIGSAFLISGSSYAVFKHYLKTRQQTVHDPQLAIRFIVQTGPQKEALKTEYLAELLNLSADRPCGARSLDLVKAKELLLKSPLISRAEVKLLSPNTLYVDYTIRQPIAWLEDYENAVLDKEGFAFPFSPFFSPKNLPAIYLGLNSFGSSHFKANWGASLKGKQFDLALEILTIVTDAKIADLFSVKRIDVSNAFAESYGVREIVVLTEDSLFYNVNGKGLLCILPRILRLSTKNYAQELGNYLKLRQQLLSEERKTIAVPEGATSPLRLREKVIDFRLQKLAFIQEQKGL